jgi:PAS domain S-box-containing protein
MVPIKGRQPPPETDPRLLSRHTTMSNMLRALQMTALALYSGLVFILDVISPLGIEVWVLNLPVILVPVLFRNTRVVVVAGLACSTMLVAGSFLSPPGANPPSWDVLNRGMGLATLWLIAAMAVNIIKRSNQLDDAVSNLQREIARHHQTSRSLQLSEERLRLAAEGARMGTFDVNLWTGKVVCSATHLRMLGYAAEQDGETTLDKWRSWVYPDDHARIQEARELALRNRSLYSVEYRIKRADNGAIGWLAVFGCFYYNEAGEGVRFVGVSFDITRRKELEREISWKDLEREILEITDRQQRHIGQEMHDGVGQELTGLGLIAQTLTQRLPETSPEKRIAVRLVAGLGELHQQIRALARGLLPVEIESKGLWAALDDLATRTSEQSEISVKFECPDWVELPDHATSMELYRITQEAVSNALRHGRPQTIRLTILPQPGGLRLRIKDDGVGIRDQAKESKGLGIRIMEYRAESIGGVLRIQPAEGGGTVVTVTLPWRNPNDHEESGIVASLNKNPDCG